MSEQRTATTSRALRRGDAAIVDASLQKGNLVAIKDPKTLTLVDLPANQTGFKLLRSDESTPKEEPKMNHILRRTKRSADPSPVMRLTFPAGTEEADVTAALKNYGMADYRVESADGIFVAMRSDLKSISQDAVTEIKLNDTGLTATVARQEAPALSTGEKAGVSVVRFEFDPAKFNAGEVQRWSAEKCVDGEVQEHQNPDDCYVVRRSAEPDGEETRRMVVEDGVTAVLVRSDVTSIPDGFIAVVSEAAYGSWGWGQLDFMALMSGRDFNEQMEDAIYALRSVLEQIMLYSQLPLDTRKDLAVRALGQFGDYIGALLDSLPRQLLVSVVRSANPQPEKDMTQATPAATATPNPAADDKTSLTRADVTALVAEAVKAGIADIVTAVRAAVPVDPAVAKAEAEAADAAKPITRGDLTAAIADAMKPILEAKAGEVVTRSAPEANPNAKPTVEPTKAEKVDSVFRGAIPGISRRPAAE